MPAFDADWLRRLCQHPARISGSGTVTQGSVATDIPPRRLTQDLLDYIDSRVALFEVNESVRPATAATETKSGPLIPRPPVASPASKSQALLSVAQPQIHGTPATGYAPTTVLLPESSSVSALGTTSPIAMMSDEVKTSAARWAALRELLDECTDQSLLDNVILTRWLCHRAAAIATRLHSQLTPALQDHTLRLHTPYLSSAVRRDYAAIVPLVLMIDRRKRVAASHEVWGCAEGLLRSCHTLSDLLAKWRSNITDSNLGSEPMSLYTSGEDTPLVDVVVSLSSCLRSLHVQLLQARDQYFDRLVTYPAVMRSTESVVNQPIQLQATICFGRAVSQVASSNPISAVDRYVRPTRGHYLHPSSL